MSRSWWDDVPYHGDERPPFTMQVETTDRFRGPCGFVQLRERHRVKAERTVTNEQGQALSHQESAAQVE